MAADHMHGERRAPAAAGHGAAAHGAHGHDGHGHGHGTHDADVAGDKKAAFVGLIGGAVLIGALMYAMVAWTNTQFAGHASGGTPAAAGAAH